MSLDYRTSSSIQWKWNYCCLSNIAQGTTRKKLQASFVSLVAMFLNGIGEIRTYSIVDLFLANIKNIMLTSIPNYLSQSGSGDGDGDGTFQSNLLCDCILQVHFSLDKPNA